MWVLYVGLQCVIVVVPGHTHLYFGTLVFFRVMSTSINITEKTGGGRVYKCLQCGYIDDKPRVLSHWYTVNSEIFARILFSRVVLKGVFAT